LRRFAIGRALWSTHWSRSGSDRALARPGKRRLRCLVGGLRSRAAWSHGSERAGGSASGHTRKLLDLRPISGKRSSSLDGAAKCWAVLPKGELSSACGSRLLPHRPAGSRKTCANLVEFSTLSAVPHPNSRRPRPSTTSYRAGDLLVGVDASRRSRTRGAFFPNGPQGQRHADACFAA